MNFGSFIYEKSGYVGWKRGTAAIILIGFFFWNIIFSRYVLHVFPIIDYNMSGKGKWKNSRDSAKYLYSGVFEL